MTQPPAGWDRTDDEPDEVQLSTQDTLVDHGVHDALDDGYSPPENYRGVTAFGVTVAGAAVGGGFEPRLIQELPDEPLPSTGPWAPSIMDYDAVPVEADEFFDPVQVGAGRAGRLVWPYEGYGPDDKAHLVGEDVGIDGGAPAGVHIVELP